MNDVPMCVWGQGLGSLRTAGGRAGVCGPPGRGRGKLCRWAQGSPGPSPSRPRLTAGSHGGWSHQPRPLVDLHPQHGVLWAQTPPGLPSQTQLGSAQDSGVPTATRGPPGSWVSTASGHLQSQVWPRGALDCPLGGAPGAGHTQGSVCPRLLASSCRPSMAPSPQALPPGNTRPAPRKPLLPALQPTWSAPVLWFEYHLDPAAPTLTAPPNSDSYACFGPDAPLHVKEASELHGRRLSSGGQAGVATSCSAGQRGKASCR